MKPLLLTTLIICIALVSASAGKFQKIDDAIVKAEKHAIDEAAHAAYVFHKANVKFDITRNGLFLVTEHEERIKVYDDQGESYATFSVGLYQRGGDRMKISGIKGVTYNYENGKIVESKLNKDAIFYEESSENYGYQRWAMPDVKAGSVIDIKYTVRSPYIYTIPRFDFQMDIPVDHVEYEVQIPEGFTYTPIPTGFVPLSRNQTERRGDTGMETVFQFEADNVSAMLDDDYVLDIDDYRGSLKYEIYMTNLPGRNIEYYSKSWDEIAKDLMDMPSIGKEMTKRTKELEPFIESLEGKTKDEKIYAIYTHVQTNYNWNKEYGLSTDVGVKKLIGDKTGNIADINLLLVNLLNQAGVITRPCGMKTRGAGILNTNYPSRSELNYVIAYVDTGDGFLLLDATSKYVPIGQLPRRATNINGVVFYDKTAKLIDIANPNEYISQAMATYDIDLSTPSLIGSGKGKRKGYGATQFRIDQDNKSEEENADEEESDDEEDDDEEEEVKLENTIEYTLVENIDNINEDINMEYTEEIFNEINKIGDEIFIDAMVDFGPDENPFYEEDRQMPIFYSSIPDVVRVVTINIPEGYKVESVPEKISAAMEGKKMKFSYRVNLKEDNFIIYYTFKVNESVFLPGEYTALKQIYDMMIEKSKEKIVLSKI